jgi:prevent-host-death family protein
MAQTTATDLTMKTMSAREAKNAFGLMIDTARAEPVLIEKHGRGVVMVIAVEEYARLTVHKGTPEKAADLNAEAPRR